MRLNITYENHIPINAFRWTPSRELQPLHYHSSLEIGLCVSGSGIFYFGEKRYRVAVGDIFIVNNRELHIAQSDKSNPSTYIFINFDPRLLLDEEESLLLPFAYSSDHFDNRITSASPLSAPIGALIEKMWRELDAKQDGYLSMAKSALLELCVLLLRHYSTRMSKLEWKRMNDTFRRLRPALAILEDRFREPLELTDIANALLISPSRASHLFQEELGRSFKDYLLQLRINEAKRLLISTNLSAADVCFESGFQSIPSFYRLFKSAVGISPLDYRSKYSVHAIIENPIQ
ncbi:helix-turn-helix domain-containing protein [Paenibacillus oceani]|uniref:Helix-turn-helix transcriptional regulator n=1 Tax=Paenibacillus oceani TaxID=2772510 RepID=A0A927H114_9BACL|nr:AraC family transcriptional regulator [Paenibacillus oceani]MBD2864691.1 helix-turn-helix transcriptional regulator [Paenibacillus oceani]